MTINVVVFNKEMAVVAINNIKVRVARRLWWPYGAKTEEEAIQLVIFYTLLQGVAVPEVPGGAIASGSTLPAALLTQAGQKAKAAIRTQQAAQAK